MLGYFALLLGFLAPSIQAEWKRPVIKFNSRVVVGDEVVVSPGTPLVLRCEGDGPVIWTTRLPKHRRYVSRGAGRVRTFKVDRPTAEFTGTYQCAYTSRNHNMPAEVTASSVHVYVKDPNRLFWTSIAHLRVVKKEGEECLLPCLLTDPTATHMGLRMDNGTTVPPGMNFTAFPHRGILIHSLHPSFNADYVCTARVGGVEKVSKAFSINVIQKLRFPPYVFLDKDEYIRIVGEDLKIRCTTHNPNFNYIVTWKHPSTMRTTIKEDARSNGENRLDIESILTANSLGPDDTGNITCIGTNEAGVNSSTTYLRVIDQPYIRLSPQLSPRLAHKGLSVQVNEGEDLELSVLVEAYPRISEHHWVTPTSPNASTQDQKFTRYNNRYHATLLLKRINAQEQGQYTFHAKSHMTNASITFHVQMYQRPVAVVRWENITTLTCTSFGYPAPRIIWYQCFGIRPRCNENTTGMQLPVPLQAPTVEVHREYGTVEVESVLTVGLSNRRMTVECVAFNLVGVSSDTLAMEVSGEDRQDRMSVSYYFPCGHYRCIIRLTLSPSYFQKPRYEIRWKIIEARDGNNYTFIDPTQLPYNEKWEFPRDKLKLGKILGAGAFGKVVEATAYGLGEEDNVMRVAVKMLKASAHSDEREALMSELKILSHLGQHKNIVNLLGACTYGGPVLLITEYCSHGDLLNFLRQRAETFLNVVMNVPEVFEETGDYKNVSQQKQFIRRYNTRSGNLVCFVNSLHWLYFERPSSPCLPNSDTSESEEGRNWPLDIEDLLMFSYQVAQGLDFLAAKNCIHRDVAARNVLLTDHGVAKICDFGLARDIMKDSNYVVKGNARLPVKWMAPESIFEAMYTAQSDVWSYGILLWEIFSLGMSPYPSMMVDTRFYKMVKGGYHMSRPDFAPPEIYAIMKMCWNLEPTERPTFSKITQIIKGFLGDPQEPDQAAYQNVEDAAVAGHDCDQDGPTPCLSPSRSCDHLDEAQPLMKTNNYQFC
ncbi:unnamed protein product [Lota lota]